MGMTLPRSPPLHPLSVDLLLENQTFDPRSPLLHPLSVDLLRLENQTFDPRARARARAPASSSSGLQHNSTENSHLAEGVRALFMKSNNIGAAGALGFLALRDNRAEKPLEAINFPFQHENTRHQPSF
jgi:hypothetical protein